MLGTRRTKVRHAALLNKFCGQAAKARQAFNVYNIPASDRENRLISADFVHKDSAEDFWLEQQWFYKRTGRGGVLMPTWDRLAQTLILMTRPQPRVVPEAAFRLFAVFMKMMLLDRLTEAVSNMLPVWTSMNAKALLENAKEESAKSDDASSTDSPKPDGGEK